MHLANYLYIYWTKVYHNCELFPLKNVMENNDLLFSHLSHENGKFHFRFHVINNLGIDLDYLEMSSLPHLWKAGREEADIIIDRCKAGTQYCPND